MMNAGNCFQEQGDESIWSTTHSSSPTQGFMFVIRTPFRTPSGGCKVFDLGVLMEVKHPTRNRPDSPENSEIWTAPASCQIPSCMVFVVAILVSVLGEQHFKSSRIESGTSVSYSTIFCRGHIRTQGTACELWSSCLFYLQSSQSSKSRPFRCNQAPPYRANPQHGLWFAYHGAAISMEIDEIHRKVSTAKTAGKECFLKALGQSSGKNTNDTKHFKYLQINLAHTKPSF